MSSNAEALARLAEWPEEMLGYHDIAAVCGVSYKSIQRARSRGESPLPEPDERLGLPPGGVALWKKSTIQAWLECRRGKGGVKGAGPRGHPAKV